jgi:hypothetical protein
MPLLALLYFTTGTSSFLKAVIGRVDVDVACTGNLVYMLADGTKT